MKKVRVIAALAIVCTLLAGSYQSQAAPGERYFPETGHSIRGAFQSYWEQHGGLERFGYPLSDEFAEVSALNGQTYTVQYFERAEFEHHPENAAPYDVLLTQLGTFRYHQLYPNRWTTEQISNDSPTLFLQTGKHIGRLLLNAWQRLGGLADIGYPISEELAERSPLDGQIYLVQYFERAEFEYHSENQPPHDVLLTQLGRFRYAEKYKPSPPVTIEGPHLAIPTQADRVQTNPQISEFFLVWDAKRLGPDKHEVQDSADIFALDLKYNKLITVTNAPCNQTHPTLADSIVVWEDANDNGSCSYTKRNIYAKDLISGQLYSVATDAAFHDNPAIIGRTVVWDESDTNGSRLISMDLASGTRRVIVSYPPDADIIVGPPLISSEYIVWTEATAPAGFQDSQLGPGWLKLYNLATHEVKTLQYADNGSYSASSLYVNQLLWSTPDNSTYLTNLDKGTSSRLPQQAAGGTIYGDTVVWSMHNPNAVGRPDLDIWGLKLNDLHPVPLVSAEGDQYNPTFGNPFAAGWLVWQNDHGPNDARLGSTTLDYAFATALQRVKGLPPLSFTKPSLLDQGVSSGPLVASSTVFWATASGIFGYTDKGEKFQVSSGQGDQFVLAGDDKTLVWGKIKGSKAFIHAYDIASRREVSVFDFPGYNGEGFSPHGFAVNDGVLYYSHDNPITKGFSLFARNLASGQEQVVKDGGIGPVVSGGYLLWHETVCAGTGSFACAPPQVYIYVRKLDGSAKDIVIDLGGTEQPLSGYGIYSDSVVWGQAYFGGIFSRPLGSGPVHTIFSGSAQYFNISDGKIAWVYQPLGPAQGQQALVGDLGNGVITPVTEYGNNSIQQLSLRHGLLAYLVGGELYSVYVSPGAGGKQ